MKVKHFAGYGSVNAKKVSRKVKDGTVDLHIQVWGDHEWGIRTDDAYKFTSWVGKRLDKELTDYRQIIDLKAEYDTELKDGADLCNYYVTYELAM